MRSGETHATNSGDLRHGGKQFGEGQPRGIGIEVVIHDLPENLDLRIAGVGQTARFFQDQMAGTAAFGTARERHHAEGALLIAPLDDGEIGAEGIVAAGQLRFESFVGIGIEAGDPPIAGFQLCQQLRQAPVAGRSHHQADVRRLLEDVRALLLRYASQHAEGFSLAQILAILPQARENFLLRFIADAARVVQDQIGGARIVHLAVALGDERPGDFLGVVDIHLAPEGFQKERFVGPRHPSIITHAERHLLHCLPPGVLNRFGETRIQTG